jgi:hypothetical protein
MVTFEKRLLNILILNTLKYEKGNKRVKQKN